MTTGPKYHFKFWGLKGLSTVDVLIYIYCIGPGDCLWYLCPLVTVYNRNFYVSGSPLRPRQTVELLRRGCILQIDSAHSAHSAKYTKCTHSQTMHTLQGAVHALVGRRYCCQLQSLFNNFKAQVGRCKILAGNTVVLIYWAVIHS